MKLHALTPAQIYQSRCEKFGALSKGERHNYLFAVANAAYECGHTDPASLETELIRVYDEYAKVEPDYNDCRNTARNVCQRMEDGRDAVSASQFGREDRRRTQAMREMQDAHRERWEKWARGLVAVGKDIPCNQDPGAWDGLSAGEVMDRQRQSMQDALSALVKLDQEQWIYCGGLHWDRQDRAYLDSTCAVCDPMEQRYWSPNPLDAKEHTGNHCQRVDYLLLEMDDAITPPKAEKGTPAYYDELQEQQEHLWGCLAPRIGVACLTYSGGKSIHALVPVNATVQELAQHAARLKELYSELHFDTATLDPIRKTRTPWGIRLYYTGQRGAIVDADTVDGLKMTVRHSRSERQKAEAQKKLIDLGVSLNSSPDCVRAQICYLVDPKAPHITLDELESRLQSIVDDFVEKADGVVEKAIRDNQTLPLTYENLREFIKYKKWEIWFDTTMLDPVFNHGGKTYDKTDIIINIFMDEWSRTFKMGLHFPSSAKMDANLMQLFNDEVYSSAELWLESLRWDGTDRLQAIYDTLHVTDPFEQMLVRKWLIQTCAIQENDAPDRMMAPCGVLTFQGSQGIGKTTWLTGLLPIDKSMWVIDGKRINVDDKDSLKLMMKGMMLELGELDDTLMREQSSLKAVITAKEHQIRLPYHRSETRVRAHVSVCASVNNSEFLRDTTGNRRWWTISPSGEIDLEAFHLIDKEQLWAQIKHIWDESDKTKWYETFGLTKDEMKTLAERNDRYRVDTGYEDIIRSCFDFDAPKTEWREMIATQVAMVAVNAGNTPEMRDVTPQMKEVRAVVKSLKAMGIQSRHAKYGMMYLMPPKMNPKDLADKIRNDNAKMAVTSGLMPKIMPKKTSNACVNSGSKTPSKTGDGFSMTSKSHENQSDDFLSDAPDFTKSDDQHNIDPKD